MAISAEYRFFGIMTIVFIVVVMISPGLAIALLAGANGLLFYFLAMRLRGYRQLLPSLPPSQALATMLIRDIAVLEIGFNSNKFFSCLTAVSVALNAWTWSWFITPPVLAILMLAQLFVSAHTLTETKFKE